MTEHRLKIEKEYLDAKLSGRKLFEIRNNDRDYKAGDYTIYLDGQGHEHRFKITYVCDYEQKPGNVVFGEEPSVSAIDVLAEPLIPIEVYKEITVRGTYDQEKLRILRENLPSGIEFAIDYRKGDDDLFSLEKGKVDNNVLAIVDCLADKMFHEAGEYQVPLTKNGCSKFIPTNCFYLVDSLFHAVDSVFYDDKSCAYYEVNINESKLTKEGLAVLSQLKKEEYCIEVDILLGGDDGYSLSGSVR